jgi:hypothetical protein
MKQDNTKRYFTHKSGFPEKIEKHQTELGSTIQDTVLQTFNEQARTPCALGTGMNCSFTL